MVEDMAGKISELLSSSEGLEKIKAVASSLFSGSDEPQKNVSNNDGSNNQGSKEEFGGFSLPDGIDPIKIMGVLSALQSPQNDKRTGLLLALKPHMSSERQERVDKAVKLLKIAAVIPVLKNQGLLDLF